MIKNVTKQEWITALESGEYHQGQALLRYGFEEGEPPRLCCLGVLAELHGFERKEEREGGPGYSLVSHYTIPSECYGQREAEWSRTEDSTLPYNLLARVLKLPLQGWSTDSDSAVIEILDEVIHMNDGGKSFADIASYLRSLPEKENRT